MIKTSFDLWKKDVVIFMMVFFIFFLCILSVFGSSMIIIDTHEITTELYSDDNKCLKTDNKISKKWTIMMYLAYDNHMDRNKNHIFEALTKTGSTDDVNIVALYDGNKNGDTAYYYALKDTLELLFWDESESNLAEKEVLEKFFSRTIEDFPAEHYAFFIQSTHGSGWQGLGCDMDGELSLKKISYLSLENYSKALKNVTRNGENQIDIMGFEICVTGSLEAAYQISPYCKYMISNQEHSFNNDSLFEGIETEWNFTNTIEIVTKNPMIAPEKYSIEIVKNFDPKTLPSKIFFKINPPKWYPIVVYKTDLSASNLSNIDQLIEDIKILSNLLVDNIEQYKEDINIARLETREYGKQYNKLWWLPFYTLYLQLDPLGYDCFIDLYDFIDNLNQITDSHKLSILCDNILTDMNKLVMFTNHVPDDETHGFSIYFPELKSQYDQFIWRTPLNSKFKTNPTPYDTLAFSDETNWNIFLETYLGIK